MSEEVKVYLKRVDELWDRLTGEDEETLQWLIFGYNQCAKLLNETEQQCKKQKEVFDKIYELIKQHIRKDEFLELNEWQTRDLLKLLKESLK